eukprot:g455.t1
MDDSSSSSDDEMSLADMLKHSKRQEKKKQVKKETLPVMSSVSVIGPSEAFKRKMAERRERENSRKRKVKVKRERKKSTTPRPSTGSKKQRTKASSAVKKRKRVVYTGPKDSTLKRDGNEIKLLTGTSDLKPGQKYPTPSPGQGTRVFYESLLKQRNDSKIALRWCTEHGVYPVYSAAVAAKMVEKMKDGKDITKAIQKANKRRLGGGNVLHGSAVDVGLSTGVWEGSGSVDI